MIPGQLFSQDGGDRTGISSSSLPEGRNLILQSHSGGNTDPDGIFSSLIKSSKFCRLPQSAHHPGDGSLNRRFAPPLFLHDAEILTCILISMSPIRSGKMVPPWAILKLSLPFLFLAPVKELHPHSQRIAPAGCPNGRAVNL